METGITIAVITGALSILGASLTYFLTKRKEREDEQRKLKIEYYKGFMISLAKALMPLDQTILESISFDLHEAIKNFYESANTLIIVAPYSVVSTLNDYIYASSYDRAMAPAIFSKLMFAIRKDIGVSNDHYNKEEFIFQLFAIPNSILVSQPVKEDIGFIEPKGS